VQVEKIQTCNNNFHNFKIILILYDMNIVLALIKQISVTIALIGYETLN